MELHQSSFRDRDGFVFEQDGRILRRINPSYVATYSALQKSGLYRRLWDEGRLVRHREMPALSQDSPGLTLEPEQIPVILYPYEWCFSQLKDAALLTIRLQRTALQLGFTLKDASAYNIQYYEGRPLLIDTLSFEPYLEGRPWNAYRQFCQHFLAPLALMARCDVRLGQLLRTHIDGIPLDLASNLLPHRTWFNSGLLFHIHLHAKAQIRFQNNERKVAAQRVSRNGLLGILDSLESTIKDLTWKPNGTEWAEYYSITNYEKSADEDKRRTIDAWLAQNPAKYVWDFGANDGRYSRFVSGRSVMTVAWDVDPSAVEKCYLFGRKGKERFLLPALLDLTNPSPSLGWNLTERMSLFDRRQPNLVLALALLHHLAIGNNVPLPQCAAFFARTTRALIIEWVPKSDSKVQELLRNRADIFPDYTEDSFAEAFTRHYHLTHRHPIQDSSRVMYFFERR